MKRILFALFIVVAFVSCEGPMGPMGPEGDPAGSWAEDNFTIRSSEWQSKGVAGTNQFYYYHTREWAELDNMAVERGVVIGYVEDFNGNYTALPHVYHDKDGDYEWTETTSLTFFEGGFEIQVTNSDFEDVPPGDKYFRIIIFK